MGLWLICVEKRKLCTIEGVDRCVGTKVEQVKNRAWQQVKESMAVKRTAEVDVMGIFQHSLGELVRC